MYNISTRRVIIIIVIAFFIGTGFATGIIENNGINSNIKTEYPTATDPYNGCLSGYVTDTSMNPIEGAKVRVSFFGCSRHWVDFQ